MPFSSLAQSRLFFAAANTVPQRWRGAKKPKITLAMARRWAEETDWSNLPRHIARLRARRKLRRTLDGAARLRHNWLSR